MLADRSTAMAGVDTVATVTARPMVASFLYMFMDLLVCGLGWRKAPDGANLLGIS
jgi:hypothetical protein